MEKKNTGIIRRMDELGRVVIPIEIRNQLNIAVKDPIDIYVKGETIVLEKVKKTCVFCGSKEKLKTYNDKNICDNCCKNISLIT